jgi:hypothetical protein
LHFTISYIDYLAKYINMRKHTRSILDEITGLVPKQDKHLLVEGLAVQAIARVINLMEVIQQNYTQPQADELIRRLQLAIKNGDTAKFTRGVRSIKENDQ